MLETFIYVEYLIGLLGTRVDEVARTDIWTSFDVEDLAFSSSTTIVLDTIMFL